MNCKWSLKCYLKKYYYVYHKNVNEDKHVTVNVDEDGNKLTDLDGYTFVSKSEPVKTVEALPNGDTVTTYTTTNVYKKEAVMPVDPIIEGIKSGKDKDVLAIKDQILKDDTGVSIQQAEKLADEALTRKVMDGFIKMVNKEQTDFNEKQASVTKDDAAFKELAGRSIEVMYYFEHEMPSNMVEGEDYVIDRESGEIQMMFSNENIAQHSISKSAVNGDSDKLALLIAQAMFQQYIEEEREAYRNGAAGPYLHYENIIASAKTDMVGSIFIVDTGGYYTVSSVVVTGNTTLV